jgi:hypothetical protein
MAKTCNYDPVTRGLTRFQECGMGCPFDSETIRKLEADARALWAVRVLDRQLGKLPSGSSYELNIELDGCWIMFRDLHGDSLDGPWDKALKVDHPHPDAARIAAADELVAEDPSLGEGL